MLAASTGIIKSIALSLVWRLISGGTKTLNQWRQIIKNKISGFNYINIYEIKYKKWEGASTHPHHSIGPPLRLIYWTSQGNTRRDLTKWGKAENSSIVDGFCKGIKGNVKIKVMLAHLIKGCRLLWLTCGVLIPSPCVNTTPKPFT